MHKKQKNICKTAGYYRKRTIPPPRKTVTFAIVVYMKIDWPFTTRLIAIVFLYIQKTDIRSLFSDGQKICCVDNLPETTKVISDLNHGN